MQELILAVGVTLTILTISALRSPRIRAAVYSLPIPITIILLGTKSLINSTHPFSLIFVIIFMVITWYLYEKRKLSIVKSLVIAVLLYILMGLINQLVVKVPFIIVYILLTLFWLFWITVQPLSLVKPENKLVKLGRDDYLIRGASVFGLTYLMVGIRELILGASVTFPYNGIFTAYIMRDSLLYLINEVTRNFIGIINFFGVIYILQNHQPRIVSFIAGWLVCGILVFVITNFVPRKRLLKV